MKNFRTIILAAMAFLSAFSACQKAEEPSVPGMEKSPDYVPNSETSNEDTGIDIEVKDEPYDPYLVVDYDDLTEDELVEYMDTHGTTWDSAYSVRDIRQWLSVYLNLITGGAADGIKDCYVGGYVVGYIPSGKRTIAHMAFGTGDGDSNVVLADDANETDPVNCIAVQLANGSRSQKEVKAALNLKDHPENLGQFIIVMGKVTKYYGAFGVKNTKDLTFIIEEE